MDDFNQLRKELQSTDLEKRVAAAEALGQAGPDAAEAVVELVVACGDDESVREWAVAALESLETPPQEARQELTELVSSSDALTAYWAITMLGRMGVDGNPSQAELANVLVAASDLSVRERAAWALGKVEADSDVAVAALQQAAQAGEARLSRLARESLSQIQGA